MVCVNTVIKVILKHICSVVLSQPGVPEDQSSGFPMRPGQTTQGPGREGLAREEVGPAQGTQVPTRMLLFV